MRIFALDPGFYKLHRLAIVELSAEARRRLEAIDSFALLQRQGVSSQQAAQALRIPRSTLYRWRQRLRSRGPHALEPGSRRPQRVRKPC